MITNEEYEQRIIGFLNLVRQLEKERQMLFDSIEWIDNKIKRLDVRMLVAAKHIARQTR